MRKTLGYNVLRTSAFALACFALAGSDVQAAALQNYSTSVQIYGNGISGDKLDAISYNPVVAGAFTSPSSVGLGEFVVSTLTGDPKSNKILTTHYDNTKFAITYTPLGDTLTDAKPHFSPVTITGALNGDITGNQSSVKAMFDPIPNEGNLVSLDGKALGTIKVLNNPLDLVPASAGGRTTVQGWVVISDPKPAGDGNNVPEPTTFAILATSIVGLGLRHRLRSRKAA